jgi:hypothetical protein
MMRHTASLHTSRIAYSSDDVGIAQTLTIVNSLLLVYDMYITVGFPGETEAQFENTLDLMRKVKYDNLNTFAYSPRPNTEAALWDDQALVIHNYTDISRSIYIYFTSLYRMVLCIMPAPIHVGRCLSFYHITRLYDSAMHYKQLSISVT